MASRPWKKQHKKFQGLEKVTGLRPEMFQPLELFFPKVGKNSELRSVCWKVGGFAVSFWRIFVS